MRGVSLLHKPHPTSPSTRIIQESADDLERAETTPIYDNRHQLMLTAQAALAYQESLQLRNDSPELQRAAYQVDVRYQQLGRGYMPQTQSQAYKPQPPAEGYTSQGQSQSFLPPPARVNQPDGSSFSEEPKRRICAQCGNLLDITLFEKVGNKNHVSYSRRCTGCIPTGFLVCCKCREAKAPRKAFRGYAEDDTTRECASCREMADKGKKKGRHAKK